MCSVAVTTINVAGFMHFWGMDVETLSTMILIIGVGISVDYSAHVTHSFLRQKGCKSREERIIGVLAVIGPAVLNGALSTLLSIVLLSVGDSHVTYVIFRVFFLVVLFAFWNSVAVVPVALSFFGGKDPQPDGESLLGKS